VDSFRVCSGGRKDVQGRALCTTEKLGNGKKDTLQFSDFESDATAEERKKISAFA